MKYLYILRHSKAGQTNKSIIDDHERPLTQKGRDLCERIGKYFRSFDNLPELVLCSTSTRTKETSELTLQCFDQGIPPTEYISNLYLASAYEVFDRIRSVDNNLSSVLIVGHNPGLQQFCLLLTGKCDKKVLRQLKTTFSPGSLASFELDIDIWSEINRKSGELLDLKTKKTYPSS